MEFGKKERDLIIGLVGVVAAILVWFLVASPYKEKTARLQSENESLKPTVEEYQAIASTLTDYQDRMVILEDEKADIISRYPSAIEREDEIMFWSNLEKEYPGEIITRDLVMSDLEFVQIEAPEVVKAVEYDDEGNVVETQDDIANENAEKGSTILMMKLPINIKYTATYAGMKDIWTYINMQNDKNQLEAMTVEFDEATGNLRGDFDLNLYFMSGTEKEYTKTFIPMTITGQPDLFGTIGVSLDLAEPAEAEE